MRIWIWGVLYLGNVCNTEPVDVKSIKALKCPD